MANLSVISLFIALTFAIFTSTIVTSAPVESDVSGAMIESPKEQLTDEVESPTTTDKPDENSNDVDDTTTIIASTTIGNKNDSTTVRVKSQRSHPIYYVNTKVNGKFGKSVRAFSSDEFVELFPIIKKD